MQYYFSVEKNEKLKKRRNVNFDDVLEALSQESYSSLVAHPNRTKYPGQYFLLVLVKNYIHVVPCEVDLAGDLLLKTVYPSRKYNKLYLQEGGKNA